jgi:hypothetical protein
MSKVLTPIKAIRAKCLDCSCHQAKEIRECPITTCPLWPYRMGKRPRQLDLATIGPVNHGLRRDTEAA